MLRRSIPLSCALAVALLGCSEPPRGPAVPAGSSAPAPTTSASAAAPPRGPLGVATFVEDDYARAEAQAKAEGKLLFVDVWAPWCHTCLAMKHGVFDAPALGAHAASFVFASLDGDREENAAFVAAHPLRVWPTFFVVDPTSRGIVALYGGSLSLDELERFLDDAWVAHAGVGGPFADEAKAIAEAHEAFAGKKYERAAELYTTASASEWPRRTEALLGAMYSMQSAKAFARCGSFGVQHLGDVRGASSQADFIAILRGCAEKATDIDARKSILSTTLERLRALAAHFPEGASVDDQADLLDMLADAEHDAGDDAAARRTHEARLALLEGAAKSAGSSEAARVFDYARMGSLLALDRGAEAETLFLGRVKEFPDSYEAWARLASTQHTLGKDKPALGSIDRAIELSYGPRKLRYMVLKAEIQTALGDLSGARATVEAEIAAHAGLPAGQFDQAKLDDAKARLQHAIEAERMAAGPPKPKP
ncbi:MAG: thioredoxin family protein [Polyangiaceae bacterium]